MANPSSTLMAQLNQLQLVSEMADALVMGAEKAAAQRYESQFSAASMQLDIADVAAERSAAKYHDSAAPNTSAATQRGFFAHTKTELSKTAEAEQQITAAPTAAAAG